MDKQAQDRLWNELSEEKKEKYSKDYKEAMEDCGEPALIERRKLLADIFGIHNLNPEPIKKEGWVNVYYPYDGDRTKREVLNMIFSTKEEAETGKDNCLNYITTVKIEWEE